MHIYILHTQKIKNIIHGIEPNNTISTKNSRISNKILFSWKQLVLGYKKEMAHNNNIHAKIQDPNKKTNKQFVFNTREETNDTFFSEFLLFNNYQNFENYQMINSSCGIFWIRHGIFRGSGIKRRWIIFSGRKRTSSWKNPKRWFYKTWRGLKSIW